MTMYSFSSLFADRTFYHTDLYCWLNLWTVIIPRRRRILFWCCICLSGWSVPKRILTISACLLIRKSSVIWMQVNLWIDKTGCACRFKWTVEKGLVIHQRHFSFIVNMFVHCNCRCRGREYQPDRVAWVNVKCDRSWYILVYIQATGWDTGQLHICPAWHTD